MWVTVSNEQNFAVQLSVQHGNRNWRPIEHNEVGREGEVMNGK